MRMKKENMKQVVISCIAFVLIIFGYYSYYNTSTEEIIEVSSRDNEETFGDVELVNSDPVNETLENIVSNDELEEIIFKEDDSYFQDTKLERERTYSEMIEIYQGTISNSETPEDQKSIAAQEINNITKIKNQIMVSENLILNKGFENVVILVNNGNVNVIVKTANLMQEDIAKIQNIIEREFDVKIENINISNK